MHPPADHPLTGAVFRDRDPRTNGRRLRVERVTDSSPHPQAIVLHVSGHGPVTRIRVDRLLNARLFVRES